MERLFGTDGVRGITNVELTPSKVIKLALSIGYYFGSGSKLLIGRDSRAGSSFIHHIITGALLSEGIRVYDAGMVPTPALQYYIKKKGGFDGGIMITASHNPPEYSGVKVIMADGVEAPRSVEEEIERAFWESKSIYAGWTALGNDVIRVEDVKDVYIDGILGLVDIDRIKSRMFKVVVDPANNVGSLTTPKLLRRLGVEVVSINSELTHLPSRNPEPTPESLSFLSRAVRITGADLGVAHDGDADRAVFVDNEGEVIPGDRSAVLLCTHIARNRMDRTPRRVFTAVSSSTLVEDYLKELGVEVVWTKVGSVTIAREMLREGAMAGFEENGGFMYPPHQYVRDGAMSVALMLEFLSIENCSLSEAVQSLPRRYLIKAKMPLSSRDKLEQLYTELRKAFSKERIIDVDGIKAIGEGYWLLVRPSGTEPVLRVFVEAESKEEAEKLLNSVRNIVRQVL